MDKDRSERKKNNIEPSSWDLFAYEPIQNTTYLLHEQKHEIIFSKHSIQTMTENQKTNIKIIINGRFNRELKIRAYVRLG